MTCIVKCDPETSTFSKSMSVSIYETDFMSHIFVSEHCPEYESQLFETEKSLTSELLHASDRKGCA